LPRAIVVDRRASCNEDQDVLTPRALVAAIGIVVAAALASAASAQGLIATLIFKPHHSFADEKTAPAPDYALDASWAALPHDDNGGAGGATPPQTDVFFVYPTTFLSPESWNAAFDNPGRGVGGSGVDATLRNQASAFAKCCRIFAPRYRQATFFAFFDRDGDGIKAVDLAYQDVRRAFDEFVAHRNNGRPFIVAGHSQGSIHLLRLIQERIAGTPLQKQMVAAYPIGAAVPAEFNAISPCKEAAQTGCLVTWNSVSDPDYDRSRGGTVPLWLDGRYQTVGNRRLMCVNPLDWHVDGAGPASANTGSLSRTRPGGDPMMKPAYAAAKCMNGRLVVDLPADRADFRSLPGDSGGLHIYDYNLFYANLQDNAVARASAFASQR
jgi:hypothetical protein